MKRNWRRWAVGVSIAAMIAAVFWMRELASWRPVVVAKVDFQPEQMRFSRDGKELLIAGDAVEAIVNVERGVVDSNSEHTTNFDKDHGLETFPQVKYDPVKMRLVFLPKPNQKIVLPTETRNEVDLMTIEEGRYEAAWSREQGEVYCLIESEIYIWNWNGKLKRRTRFFYNGIAPIFAAFSPDKRWIVLVSDGTPVDRYNLHTNQKASVAPESQTSRLGFSPDSRFIWFIREDVNGLPLSFHIARDISIAKWSTIQNFDCSGPAKWLPDGRIGLIRERSFEWRDASGRLLRRLSGPFQKRNSSSQGITDWALSPDENWIYSCHSDGTIRKWRAR